MFGGERGLFETLRHLNLNLRAPRELLSGLDSDGMMAIITQ